MSELGSGVVTHEPNEYGNDWRAVWTEPGRMSSGCFPSEGEAQTYLDEKQAGQLAYWNERVRWVKAGEVSDTGQRVIRFGGDLFTIGKEPTEREIRAEGFCFGYGGRRWHLRMLDTGEEIVTHNLWHHGPIPAEYRKALPDNAEVVR